MIYAYVYIYIQLYTSIIYLPVLHRLDLIRSSFFRAAPSSHWVPSWCHSPESCGCTGWLSCGQGRGDTGWHRSRHRKVWVTLTVTLKHASILMAYWHAKVWLRRDAHLCVLHVQKTKRIRKKQQPACWSNTYCVVVVLISNYIFDIVDIGCKKYLAELVDRGRKHKREKKRMKKPLRFRIFLHLVYLSCWLTLPQYPGASVHHSACAAHVDVMMWWCDDVIFSPERQCRISEVAKEQLEMVGLIDGTLNENFFGSFSIGFFSIISPWIFSHFPWDVRRFRTLRRKMGWLVLPWNDWLVGWKSKHGMIPPADSLMPQPSNAFQEVRHVAAHVSPQASAPDPGTPSGSWAWTTPEMCEKQKFCVKKRVKNT